VVIGQCLGRIVVSLIELDRDETVAEPLAEEVETLRGDERDHGTGVREPADLRPAQRPETMSSSAGPQSTVRFRLFVTGSGSDGCDSTGATTRRSTAIARAKPPLKHIPTTPTPGPPDRSCSWAASSRNQPITGDVRPVARTVNSRLMHAAAIEPRTSCSGNCYRPWRHGRPCPPYAEGGPRTAHDWPLNVSISVESRARRDEDFRCSARADA
jgi:hypothetical protein